MLPLFKLSESSEGASFSTIEVRLILSLTVLPIMACCQTCRAFLHSKHESLNGRCVETPVHTPLIELHSLPGLCSDLDLKRKRWYVPCVRMHITHVGITLNQIQGSVVFSWFTWLLLSDFRKKESYLRWCRQVQHIYLWGSPTHLSPHTTLFCVYKNDNNLLNLYAAQLGMPMGCS